MFSHKCRELTVNIVCDTWVINTHCIPEKFYYKGHTIIWVPFVIQIGENYLSDLTVEISNKKERTQKINNKKQINQQTLKNVCKEWRNKNVDVEEFCKSNINSRHITTLNGAPSEVSLVFNIIALHVGALVHLGTLQ